MLEKLQESIVKWLLGLRPASGLGGYGYGFGGFGGFGGIQTGSEILLVRLLVLR